MTAVAPGAGTPTGTVDFDGDTLLGAGTLSGGVATFTTAAEDIGSHAITTTYEGDANFIGSTSPVDSVSVDDADTTTALTAAPDPTVFGQSATFTATVTTVAPAPESPPAR